MAVQAIGQAVRREEDLRLLRRGECNFDELRIRLVENPAQRDA
jgi:hypothetical protein